MWRAEVIEVRYPGWVVVIIPKLFNDSPIGPIQSSVPVQVGDLVVVADLAGPAKTRDWWVLGLESRIGLGTEGPTGAHTHPMGQIDGLVDALAGKASQSEYAATKADVDAATYLVEGNALMRRYSNGHVRVPDSPGTLDAAQAGWVDTNYTSKTTFNNGMAAKADAPGNWQNLTLGSGVTVDATQSGPSPRARWTALGLQIQGRRLRGPSTPPSRDQVFATVPASLIPPYDITFSVDIQRAASGNGGAHVTMKLKTGTGDIQYVSDPVASGTSNATAQTLTGGGVSDYITLNNILLAW